MKIDLHVHTMWSGDSTTTPDELAAGIAAAGIDVVCITDHHALAGAQRFVETGELGPDVRVVVGEEIRTRSGEVIGLFLTERIPLGMSAPDTCRAIRDQGGLVYVPHPFDPMRRCLDEAALRELLDAGLVDAIEAFNAKVSLQHLNERGAAIAAEYGVAAGAGSDAHVPEALGAAYVACDPPADATPGAFLDAVRAGTIVGRHADPPRPWRARVIPSI